MDSDYTKPLTCPVRKTHKHINAIWILIGAAIWTMGVTGWLTGDFKGMESLRQLISN